MIGARRISGALGAEISGVDLARPLSSEDFAEIRRLMHRITLAGDVPR